MALSLHDPVRDYAESVASGEVPACALHRQACERHLRDLKRQRWRYRFDLQKAMRVVEFFGFLPHVKGEWAGTPLSLEPWQIFIVGSLFGWVDKKTGLRRFRTAYVELPRKQGKSFLASGIGIYMAFFDDEPGAEVYAFATKKEQAKIVWGDASAMVERREAAHLRKRIGVSKTALYSLKSNSKFAPLGADSKTLDGLNIHCGIGDEIHAHPNRKLVDVIETAMGARRQPLIFEITTAGVFDPHSICWEHHEYSQRVMEGKTKDDTWFSFMTGLDPGDLDDPHAWKDESLWRKAQPNYGVSSKAEDMQRLATKAAEIPAAQNTFLRLRLNVWTEQVDRWIDMATWDAGAGPVGDLTGRRCFAGLDLASTIDVAALVLLFPPETEGEPWKSLHRFWIPGANIAKRVDRDRVPYDVWKREGIVTATEGNVIDYRAIRRDILALSEEYRIAEIGFDPWNSAQIVIELGDDGANMVPVRQGFMTMAPAVRELEKLIVGREYRHGGCPVMRWMAGNVSLREDPAGNRKIDKAKSAEKVDGLVALAMAVSRANVDPGETASAYATRGVRTL